MSVFTFPTDTAKRAKWVKLIHRSHLVPDKRSIVYIKHFDDKHVVREDSFTRPDGTVSTVKRDKLKLSPNAVSFIFCNQRTYMTTKLRAVRKDPSARSEEINEKTNANGKYNVTRLYKFISYSLIKIST